MDLSKEQQIAFDKYVQGHNIFITGPGAAVLLHILFYLGVIYNIFTQIC